MDDSAMTPQTDCEPVQKRLRPDEERDQDLYFPDGNIVLIARDGVESITYFRVHQSILAKHSPVFKDLFSIPTPPQSEIERYDGVPRVELQDDPNDLKTFLQFMYEPFSSPLRSWGSMSTSQVACEMNGPLKLANKYQVDALRTELIDEINSRWPSDLEEWDTMEGDIRHDPAAVIRLAREGDVPELFPVAFYLLSTSFSNQEKDWQPSSPDHHRDSSSPRLYLLSRADMATLAFGRGEMAKWISSHLSATLRLWTCQAGGKCNSHILLHWAEIQNSLLCQSMDILGVLLHYTKRQIPPEHFLCYECRSSLVKQLKDIRRFFFPRLPSVFGLVNDTGD